MEMKTKTLMIGLVLTAVILAPLAIAADEDDPPRGPRSSGFQRPAGPGQRPGRGFRGDLARQLMGRLGERLALTDEQKEQIRSITESNQEKAEETRKAVRETMQALNQAAQKGVEAEIIAAGKAAGDALTQQALHRAAVAKEVKAVLTEEQLTKLEEIRAEMRERMQRRLEEGPGPRGARRGQRGPRPPQTPEEE